LNFTRIDAPPFLSHTAPQQSAAHQHALATNLSQRVGKWGHSISTRRINICSCWLLFNVVALRKYSEELKRSYPRCADDLSRLCKLFESHLSPFVA
jgi:hypothetical protein